jgi:hypothetical protein
MALTTGYKKAKGSKGISNPKKASATNERTVPKMSLPGKMDSRVSNADRKQSAK